MSGRFSNHEGPRYRKLCPVFWSDERVIDMSMQEKMIAIYCLTGPQTNRVGIYRLSPGMASEEIGTLYETFLEGFKNVVKTLGWKYDERFRVLYIPTWWKYNQPENPNTLKGNLKDLVELPKSHLLQEFASNTEYLNPNLVETLQQTLGERYPKPSPNQEQEQEQEQDNNTTIPNGIVLQPEFRNEEDFKLESESPSTLEVEPDSETQTTLIDDPVVCEFKTKAGEKTFQLTESMLAKHEARFGGRGIDVRYEVQRAAAWTFEAEGYKLKTHRGTPSFISRWLNTEIKEAAKSRSRYPPTRLGPAQRHDPQAALKDPDYGKF